MVEVLCAVPKLDFNLADCEGTTPLLAVCSAGYADILKVIATPAYVVVVLYAVMHQGESVCVALCVSCVAVLLSSSIIDH